MGGFAEIGATLRRTSGRRGAILATLGAMDIAYGVSLRQGGPGLQGPLLGLAFGVWSWVWLGVGVFLLAGSLVAAVHRGAIFWAVAALLKWVWAFALLAAIAAGDVPAPWGVALIFLGFAVVVFLCSGWPNPPKVL